MRSSPVVSDARDAVVEQARGVLAERFGVEIATADAILCDVARVQRRSVMELAAAIVASCSDESAPLPWRLYPHSDGITDAA
jgi:hypothetical protein